MRIQSSNSLLNRTLPLMRPPYDPARLSPECPHKNLLPITIRTMRFPLTLIPTLINSRRAPLCPTRDATSTLALVIPFRNRHRHLEVFAPAVRAHLERQGIRHEIIVVEQEFGKPFNKGALMNIGALLASPDARYFCFHDVDLLPQGSVDYSYCSMPLRLFGYLHSDPPLEYATKDGKIEWHNFGGVTLVPRELFALANGFSNGYWHWGNEDDDFFLRFIYNSIVPLCDEQGKFQVLTHKESVFTDEQGHYVEDAAERRRLRAMRKLNGALYKRFRRRIVGNESGLDNVSYQLLSTERHEHYRLIKVSL